MTRDDYVIICGDFGGVWDGSKKGIRQREETHQMSQNDQIQLFEDKRIRTAWDVEKEEWYFSIVDVVSVLTDSTDPAAYWRKLKQRLKSEGNEIVTKCHGLKMTAANGKKRLTDEITRAWSGMSTRQYKNLKGLKKRIFVTI